ncbi:MAG TPA: protein kinase [Bryobacteraceae bacterium]|nr:protein kinase [Bryobacteraceae bacterium]
MPFSAGDRLGPYEILAPLGAGGMGEVYRARDTRLDRIVAIKVAHEQFSERFEREARAIAALNHPNICTLHDVGPNYLVMEYVEGEPLKTPPAVDRVMQFALQIADGVAAAHAKGIVHRDLKPGNILVTPDGRVKILDFGLATLQAPAPTDATLTRGLTDPGTAVGTVGYMSPEQARGETVDARSDLWSMGVIFYELLCGVRPFEGSTQAVIFEGILTKTPVSLSERNPKIPADWERIVARLLEKDRATRYQSAQDLLADLKRVSRDSNSIAAAPAATGARLGWRKYAIAACAGVIVLVAIAYFLPRRAAAIDSLAILPFANANHSADADYLSDGITDSLIGNLSSVRGLKVKSSNAVRRYKGGDIDAGQAGRELDVGAVLTGRIVQRGDSLSIRADLIDTRDNSEIWGENFERKTSEILSVEQDITSRISGKLRLSGEDKQQLARRQTANPEAYQLYLKGRYFTSKFTKDGVDKGLDYYRQAIAADPNYALAYQGLASYYGIIDDVFVPASDAWPKAKAAALKAVELDDHLAESHEALASVLFWHEYDWAGAEKELRRAIELNPNLAGAHTLYGWLLTCVGRTQQGIEEGRKAQTLDPLAAEPPEVLAQDLYLARRYPEAVEESRKALEVDPKYFLAHVALALTYIAQGRTREAIAAARTAREDEPLADWTTAVLGMAYSAAGQRSEAEKALAEMKQKASGGWVPSYAFAEIYAGLRDKPATLDALEKSYQERAWFLTYLNTAPEFDFIRSEPRFQALLRRMNFPH